MPILNGINKCSPIGGLKYEAHGGTLHFETSFFLKQAKLNKFILVLSLKLDTLKLVQQKYCDMKSEIIRIFYDEAEIPFLD